MGPNFLTYSLKGLQHRSMPLVCSRVTGSTKFLNKCDVGTYKNELLPFVDYGEVSPALVREEIISTPIICHASATVHSAVIKERT